VPELLAALDAFVQEHRRCGDLDGGVDGERVWMANYAARPKLGATGGRPR
jgi:hypothetical protein